MAAADEIVCDYLPRGMKLGYMSNAGQGVRRWHPSGTSVAIPDGPGRFRLAADVDIEIDAASVIKNYHRLP